MLEGRCPVQTCRPRRLKMVGWISALKASDSVDYDKRNIGVSRTYIPVIATRFCASVGASAPREPPARPMPSLRSGIGAVQPSVAAAPERLRRVSGWAPGGRRQVDLGRRVTDANAAVVDAILARPAALDPLRAATLTALPYLRTRSRPPPA